MLGLRPYQNQAVDFLFERDRALVLASVGAGKTCIALTAMEALLDEPVFANGRWLVIAPKRVCTDVWPVELPKWTRRLKCRVAIGSEKERRAAFADPAVTGANVVVINYDNIQWLAKICGSKTLADFGFKGVVFDELTRLKNPSGARFKALAKIIEGVPVRYGLTGSFTSNGLEDVFGQCKIIDQKLLGRAKGAFMQQYFVCINQEYNQWEPRKGALEHVMQRIKPATFVLEPGEYKDKLPPLHVVETLCTMNMTDYEAMKRDFVVQFDDATAIAANAAVVTSKLQQMASGFVYADKPKWISKHKFDRLDELLDENQHANTIIAYGYREELDELKRRYPQAKTLDDEKAVDNWNAGKIPLLLVHPKSAGHGLNLQHGGHHIVFLSLPWSLELYEQTVGRLHRSGQRHDVWCYVFLTSGTVDERIWAALHDKRAISDIALEALK